MQEFSKKNAGLSLAETIVALGVLVVGLLGGVLLASYSINTMTFSENLFVANRFATEGIELVRAERDTNWLQGKNWSDNLDPGYYVVVFDSVEKKMELKQIQQGDALDVQDPASSFGPQTLIRKNTANSGLEHYTQDDSIQGLENSPFYRHIEIQADADVMVVKSVVVFPRKNDYRVITVEDRLFNWRG